MQYTIQPLQALLCAIIGYLLGNFQSSVILSRLFFHDDVRTHGSGNAGSTNMTRTYGFKVGAFTFALDFLKALVACWIGKLLMGALGSYIGGLFVILGHCWPVFFRFKGGKGIACAVAVGWFTFPLGGAIVTVAALVIALTFRMISLASLLSVVIFFVLVLIFQTENIALIVLVVLVGIIVFWRHRANIQRILKGEEKWAY